MHLVIWKKSLHLGTKIKSNECLDIRTEEIFLYNSFIINEITLHSLITISISKIEFFDWLNKTCT